MMKPIVIAVAITGSVPRKKDNPALPVTPPEQIESTQEAFEAGATLVHIHVRNDDETPSSDPARFAAVKEGVEKHCPGMIVQFSTGGRLHGRARARSVRARLGAVSEARHGLALDRLGQLPDDRLREPHHPGGGPRRQDEGERGPARDRDFRSLPHPWRAA